VNSASPPPPSATAEASEEPEEDPFADDNDVEDLLDAGADQARDAGSDAYVKPEWARPDDEPIRRAPIIEEGQTGDLPKPVRPPVKPPAPASPEDNPY
jgi:hypothetical protein